MNNALVATYFKACVVLFALLWLTYTIKSMRLPVCLLSEVSEEGHCESTLG